MKTVTIVEITDNGSDLALYLGTTFILSADPGCGDSLDSVVIPAEAISAAMGVEINKVKVSPEADWDWDGVTEQLLKEGKLPEDPAMFAKEFHVASNGCSPEKIYFDLDTAKRDGAEFIDTFKRDGERIGSLKHLGGGKYTADF